MKWNEIKTRKPDCQGMYQIKDELLNIVGISFFDGYAFQEPIMLKNPERHDSYIITHWRELEKNVRE